MDTNLTVEEMLTRARTLLLLDNPFFGTLAVKMPMTPDPSQKTAVTNGNVIRYNPEWVAGLSEAQRIGMLGHLVLHAANGHAWRRGQRDQDTWNKACDLAINHLLTSAGLTLPSEELVDPSRRTSAEAIYSTLSEQPKPPQGGQGQGQGQQGSSSGGSSGSSQGSSEGQEDEGIGKAEKGGKGPRKQDQKPEGSEAPSDDDNASEDDVDASSTPVNDPGGCGAVEDAPVEDDAQELEAEWKVAVAQAAAAARSQGRMPAELERLVKDMLEPEVPWTTLLRDFIERTARNDYDWRRPSRRYTGGIVLPSLISEELPAVVIAVDTSGSISQRILDQFASEVSAVLGAYETTIHLVYVDARVQKTEVVTRADMPIQLKPVGGGGTDFRPAFQWVEEQGLQPAALIYLTDMMGTFPTNEPSYPVLWVKWGSYATEQPTFGQVTRMEK